MQGFSQHTYVWTIWSDENFALRIWKSLEKKTLITQISFAGTFSHASLLPWNCWSLKHKILCHIFIAFSDLCWNYIWINNCTSVHLTVQWVCDQWTYTELKLSVSLSEVNYVPNYRKCLFYKSSISLCFNNAYLLQNWDCLKIHVIGKAKLPIHKITFNL